MNFQEQQAIEILKSLAEISISGFRTLALLNGGGSVALVTYLAHADPARLLPPIYIVITLVGYVLGLVFCGLAYFTSHGTQLALYNETIQRLNNSAEVPLQRHRGWLAFARIFCILSLLAFLVGSSAAVIGFVGGIHR